MKTVTINVEGISQGQWSTFLLELNLMKKAWRSYGVDVELKAHSINKIIALGTSHGEINKRLRRNSLVVAQCSSQQYKELQEGFGSYREILLENSQDIHLKRYSKVDLNMRKFSAQSLFLRSFPRYALESLAICLLIILGLIFSIQRGQTSSLISSLGVLALASQRVLPAAQNMYQAWAAIKSNSAEFDDVIKLLKH